MQKIQKRRFFRNLLAKLLICTLIISSAMVVSPNTKAEAATAKPTISKKSQNILIGDTYDLNINHKVKNSVYKWSSSDKKVATVTKKGVVKGVKEGAVVITCTIKTSKKTYKVSSNITVISAATSFTIDNKVTALNVGQKYDLNRTLDPKNSNDKTTWSTSDSSIAAPDKNGKFTALKEGTVTITGKTLSGLSDQVIIKVVDEAGTVTNQEELVFLLGSGADLITIKTEEELTFNIPSGDYTKQKLVVDAPKADVKNAGKFESVEIKRIKSNTWYEQTIGNIINVSAPNARVVVEANANASISVENRDTQLTIVNNGTVNEIIVNQSAEINISGSSTQAIPVVANVAGATISSSTPLDLTCNERINLTLLDGAGATIVHVTSEEFIPIITGNTSITVYVGTEGNSQPRTVQPTNQITPTPVNPTPVDPTPVDPTPIELGSISGRITALTGSAISVSGDAISVSGSAISVSGSAITVSGGSIIADAAILVSEYAGDAVSAIESLLTNPNTIIVGSDAEGYYTINDLAPGQYVVVIAKEGYKVQVQLVTVTGGTTTTVNGELIELADEGQILNGIATGNLIDALTGNNVSDDLSFTLEIYENFNDTSEVDLIDTLVVSGSAFSVNLPEGYYTIKVKDNRIQEVGVTYATTTYNLVVLGGTTFSDQDIVLSTVKDEGQATFVLTWGEYPSDLDSHLIGPVEGNDTYHIFFANDQYPEGLDHYDIANLDLRLDLDDVTSYGPETTSIYKPVAGGVYTFYVYNYSGNEDGLLVNSGAKVVVTTATETMTFDVPAGGVQRSWVVCSYNSATGVITPINQLYEGDYVNTIVY